MTSRFRTLKTIRQMQRQSANLKIILRNLICLNFHVNLQNPNKNQINTTLIKIFS